MNFPFALLCLGLALLGACAAWQSFNVTRRDAERAAEREQFRLACERMDAFRERRFRETLRVLGGIEYAATRRDRMAGVR